MKEIGLKLKTKREEDGLSLEEVASDLKIRESLLKYLEEGNREAFDDVITIKYIIRDYAKYLTEELIKVNVEKNQLLKDNKKLEAEIMDLKDKNSTLKWQNDFITNSRSYKITRKIVKLVKRK